MGRPPIGKTAMSGAERQRQYMNRLLASGSGSKALARLRRENAALKVEIERLQRHPANEPINWTRIGLDEKAVRRVKAALHPDKVQHPQAKAQLEEAFKLFVQAAEPRISEAKAGAASDEEWRRRRQQARQANSARSKAAWAKRKAKKEK